MFNYEHCPYIYCIFKVTVFTGCQFKNLYSTFLNTLSFSAPTDKTTISTEKQKAPGPLNLAFKRMSSSSKNLHKRPDHDSSNDGSGGIVLVNTFQHVSRGQRSTTDEENRAWPEGIGNVGKRQTLRIFSHAWNGSQTLREYPPSVQNRAYEHEKTERVPYIALCANLSFIPPCLLCAGENLSPFFETLQPCFRNCENDSKQILILLLAIQFVSSPRLEQTILLQKVCIFMGGGTWFCLDFQVKTATCFSNERT